MREEAVLHFLASVGAVVVITTVLLAVFMGILVLLAKARRNEIEDIYRQELYGRSKDIHRD